MTTTFGHLQMENRYLIEAPLELKTALRLSSGRADLETDAPLMRDLAGQVYIPGSSFRGALRSEVERIVSAVEAAAGLTSCILFDDSGHDCITSDDARHEDFRAMTEEKVVEEVKSRICDVCHLFGSPVFGSRLVIEDLYPLASSVPAPTSIRDGVGIDRDTGTARENVKFDYEVLEPSGKGAVSFDLKMEVENLTEKDHKILELVLGLLRQGLQVGGKRSSGLGTLHLDNSHLSVKGYKNNANLWSALVAGQDPLVAMDWTEVSPC